MYSSLDRYLLIFVFMPKTLEAVHTCIMPLTSQVDSLKYSTFVSHIFPFTSMILKYSLFGNHICVFVNTLDGVTAIHKHFTFGSHSCSFTSMNNHGFLVWQILLLFPYLCQSFEIVHTCVYIQNTNAHEEFS